MTDTASSNDLPMAKPVGARLVQVAFPAPAPAAAGPASTTNGVALVTLDRPEALNALSFDLLDELVEALETLDADPACRAIVITGAGERAFAAGADIRELAPQTFASLTAGGRFAAWDRLAAVGLPAHRRGSRLRPGRRLRAGDGLRHDRRRRGRRRSASPRSGSGVMPGAGGTQRLTRAIGKARAMELILTGRTMSAPRGARRRPGDARRARRGDPRRCTGARRTRSRRCRRSRSGLPRRRSLDADERPLAEGLAREREAFFGLFDTEDQAEGMAAFTQKRPPVWSGR